MSHASPPYASAHHEYKSCDKTNETSRLRYKKCSGVAGISGHLYETKLISYILFRALHDDDIEEFYLGTNEDGLGQFDDISFRFKLKGIDRPGAVFLQARHTEDQDTALTVTITDLKRCFESYLKIRNKFNVSSGDPIFNRKFEDIECAFVFYTNRRDVINKKYVEAELTSKINDTIGTRDDAFQILIDDEDVKLLQSVLQSEDIKQLAVILARMVRSRHYNHEHFMSEQLVQTYHVMLAQHVLHITDVGEEGHRSGHFKEEFLNTTDENLLLLKESLFSELIRDNKPNKNEMSDLLSQLFSAPSEATIRKLIGGVIAYEDSKLTFVREEQLTDEILRRELEKVNAKEAVVKRAIDALGREIVNTATFKLPPEFGNKDLALRGSEMRKERRLHYLSAKIIKLLLKSEERLIDADKFKIVDIDDNFVEKGFVQLNGGLAGTVGNMLIMDEKTKLLMFANRNDLQNHPLALRLLDRISSEVDHLEIYRFFIKSKLFPKLSFDCNEHDKILIDDFMNKLLFYTNQASEREVEDILKDEIDQLLSITEPGHLQIKSEAVYLQFYDNVVKWSMIDRDARYLTKESNLFQTTTEFIWTTKLTITNTSNKYKYVKSDLKFKAEVVNSFKIDQSCSKVSLIVSDVIDFSVIKLTQHFKDTQYMLIDTNYIFNLAANDYDQLIYEMENIVKTVFILIWKTRSGILKTHKKTKLFFQRLCGKKLIVVTGKEVVQEIKLCLVHTDIDIILDEGSCLADLTETSQDTILSSEVIFQGKKVDLHVLLDEDSKVFIKGELLKKLINGETLQVGSLLTDSRYENMKEFYINRQLTRVLPSEPWAKVLTYSVKAGTSRDTRFSRYLGNYTKHPGTLYDIDDRAVLIAAEPGMGKSILLTHLALATKARDPGVWIVRIDLLDYSRFFHQWKENEVVIDTLEALRFICIDVINKKETGFIGSEKIILKDHEGEILLSDCTGLNDEILFELNMFLHFCNRRQVIFLLDGFDEICPDYKSKLLIFIGVLKNFHPDAHRVWVTSRTYNDVLDSLEQMFGYYYELNAFNSRERWEMYKTCAHSKISFIKDNMIDLNQIDSKKSNLFDFFSEESFEKAFTTDDDWDEQLRLHFVEEFEKPRRLAISPEEAKINSLKKILNDVEGFSTPRHLHIAIDYLVNAMIREMQIDTEQESTWHRDISTQAIHELLIETILKRSFFEDKSRMDMNIPGVQYIYERTRQMLTDKYKRLGAYAMFRYNLDSVNSLFNETEIKYIKDTMKSIKLGEDKSGIICDIANGVPRFLDNFIFGEYFAVEYICDSLKAECSDLELTVLWDFILHDIFFKTGCKLVYILDEKLELDDTLSKVITNERNRRTILDLLMKTYSKSPVRAVIIRKLQGWLKLFLSTFELVNSDNLRDFIKYIDIPNLLILATIHDCKEFVDGVLNTVRNIDKTELRELYSIVEDRVPGSRGVKSFILKRIRAYSLEKLPELHSDSD